MAPLLQTLPAMLLMPLSGVVIDREDRRHIVMVLDAGRGLIILDRRHTRAIASRANLAALYNVHHRCCRLLDVLANGYCLIQELTPESEFVHSNTFLLAGVQGGWLLAGAFVGFVYNHIGLGGVLLIDFVTYVASFSCYLFVRQGKHVVQHPIREEIVEVENWSLPLLP